MWLLFPVVMYGCESWTIKKAECQRTDAFELWCWRRLLRVSWTARRSNQSILKEINPEYSLEGLMLKLKLNILATWCEELTHLKRPWSGKDWKQEENGTTEDEMVTWLHRFNGHGFGWNSGVGDGRESWCAVVHWVANSWTWLSYWTELNSAYTLNKQGDNIQPWCILSRFGTSLLVHVQF